MYNSQTGWGKAEGEGGWGARGEGWGARGEGRGVGGELQGTHKPFIDSPEIEKIPERTSSGCQCGSDVTKPVTHVHRSPHKMLVSVCSCI